MQEHEFDTITPDDRPNYRALVAEVSDKIWPEYMYHDAISDLYWDGLFTDFAGYQFALLDRASNVAALANSVPVHWTDPDDELPDDGWDWALIQSAADRAAGRAATLLCGLQISVAPAYQGQGISRTMVTKMIELARRHGLARVAIPVRPIWKARYPLTSIEHYALWKRDDGLPFDPWLRVHVRAGGRILKACAQAMTIRGSIAEWQAWTDMQFFESGDYIVPGALAPVSIDLDRDTGLYVEPNVWVIHEAATG